MAGDFLAGTTLLNARSKALGSLSAPRAFAVSRNRLYCSGSLGGFVRNVGLRGIGAIIADWRRSRHLPPGESAARPTAQNRIPPIPASKNPTPNISKGNAFFPIKTRPAPIAALATRAAAWRGNHSPPCQADRAIEPAPQSTRTSQPPATTIPSARSM